VSPAVPAAKPPPCDSPFADHVLFVLGGRRSGSTWLAELLLAHPETAGVGAWEVEPGDVTPRETVVIGALDELWRNLHNPDGEGIRPYLGYQRSLATMRRFTDAMLGCGRSHHAPEASWFVEKTPSNLLRLPMLAAIYPDAWFLSIVRDGRDVARSLAQAPMGPTDAGEAAGEWVRDLDQLQLHCGLLSRFRQVRYEDVLADPVGSARAVFEWLGLAVGPDVDRAVEDRASTEVARYGSKDAVGAGKWTQLPTRDRARVLDTAGDWLAELGYLEPAPTPS
jgi:hypothetical protein